MKYIIGSGWWCDGSGEHKRSKRERNTSSNETRKLGFHDLWYHCVHKYSSPEKIFITDSASPVAPKWRDDEVVVPLLGNYEYDGIWLTGWARSLINGAYYALMNNDIEYYVYVEQDCLIIGEGIIEHVISHMEKKKANFCYGTTIDDYKIDTSFVFVKRDFIFDFIRHYLRGQDVLDKPYPERMFQYISKQRATRVTPLPFGYGRSRPIDMDKDMFYAQRWTDEELKKIKEKVYESEDLPKENTHCS